MVGPDGRRADEMEDRVLTGPREGALRRLALGT
jgi:hypothetical protein